MSSFRTIRLLATVAAALICSLPNGRMIMPSDTRMVLISSILVHTPDQLGQKDVDSTVINVTAVATNNPRLLLARADTV